MKAQNYQENIHKTLLIDWEWLFSFQSLEPWLYVLIFHFFLGFSLYILHGLTPNPHLLCFCSFTLHW